MTRQTVKNLSVLHNEFLDECKFAVRLRSETIRGYRAAFALLMLFKDTLKVRDLTRNTMVDFFEWLEKRERNIGKGIKVKGVKASTVATYRNKLQRFFEWLMEKDYLSKPPFHGIKYPKVEYSDRRFLSYQQVEKIFSAISMHINWNSTFVKLRNIAMFRVLLHCGLRKGELINLKVVDIDFDHCELFVRGETSKSKRDRYVPLSKPVLIALREYISELSRRKVFTTYLWVSEAEDRKFTLHGLKHLVNKII